MLNNVARLPSLHAIPEEFSYCFGSAACPWAAEPRCGIRPFVHLVTMNTVFYSDIDIFLAGSATAVSFTEFFTGVKTHYPCPQDQVSDRCWNSLSVCVPLSLKKERQKEKERRKEKEKKRRGEKREDEKEDRQREEKSKDRLKNRKIIHKPQWYLWSREQKWNRVNTTYLLISRKTGVAISV